MAPRLKPKKAEALALKLMHTQRNLLHPNIQNAVGQRWFDSTRNAIKDELLKVANDDEYCK